MAATGGRERMSSVDTAWLRKEDVFRGGYEDDGPVLAVLFNQFIVQ